MFNDVTQPCTYATTLDGHVCVCGGGGGDNARYHCTVVWPTTLIARIYSVGSRNVRLTLSALDRLVCHNMVA